MTFFIHTYGCQMNAHESDRLAFMLSRAGFEKAKTADNADILIFQTCSIRDTAAQKALMHISQAKKFRQKNNLNQTICVIGCLSATEKVDGVDIVLGTNDLETLVERLTLTTPERNFGIGNSVVIMNGCENFCSYCIVPYARGHEISRPADDIINEFKCLIGQAVGIATEKKAIYLLGQNVNSYRCPKTGATFVELLDKICKIEGDFIVNFISSHPKDFTKQLVDCIARNKKIERNIHLPLQSGCDRILKLMNRGYGVKQYLEKIKLLRDAVPNVHITTDIICGFPTETEAEFNETVELMQSVKFNAAFIFPYSRRRGTKADVMDGHLDKKTIMARTTKLIDIQREICYNMA